MKADVLRRKFLEFFKSKKHRVVDPDSLVPKDDPTVLFTPAGMNQFKKEFMGQTSGFRRAATCQRCLRTDDLDKVGKTACHHTLFEMLGNFSFGDYFKEDAISFAWEFLTEELNIPQEKLWVSVYKDDDESYNIWKDKIKVPVNKIVKLGDKDNFWPAEAKEKGPNGPCGPCSEIFYDFGKDVGCGESVCDPSCSCGRFVEVWNLVFTQFNRKEGGVLEPLPNKNIDTGMGLERLAAVMQGVYSNFETDLFTPLTGEIFKQIKDKASVDKMAVYAIADHLRAIVFAIFDGVIPSNEGRGYVIRKIIRKSVLALRSLGIKQAYLYRLVPVLAGVMNDFYPELKDRRENISEIILAEEKNFISTLNSSETLFKEKLAVKGISADKAGEIAFMLYDTYGIPFELTLDWARRNSVKISKESFDKELENQKKRSKSGSAMKGDVFDSKHASLGVSATLFKGYDKCCLRAKILKIFKGDDEAKKVSKGDKVSVVLDATCFYAESGGQVGDTGILIKGKNIIEISDTQKFGKVIVHNGVVKNGSFKKSDLVSASVDEARRLSIARNHTATHLLQSALRKVLGTHVKQQGSLVAPDRLRFDFTHFKALTPDELDRIELLVNEYILGNTALSKKQMSLVDAKKKGALAFFQEKYESKVRVISIGDISQELCGGTHLESTGQIGVFKIIQESSIASGTRRIEAATAKTAYELFKKEEQHLKEASALLNAPLDKVALELQKRISRIKELEKELSNKNLSAAQGIVDTLVNEAEQIKGVRFISKALDNASMDVLRKTVDTIKQKAGSAVVALGSSMQGKVFLVVGVTADLCDKGLDASKLIIEPSKIIGGSGGGRKEFAQAGGGAADQLNNAFVKLAELIAGAL